MDEKIEELVIRANGKKYYQVLIIFFGFAIYFSTNVISATYGFWILEPKVNYTLNGVNYTEKINRTICEQTHGNYKIVERKENSWVWYYGYECNSFVKSMINMVGQIGSLVGILLVPLMINLIGEKPSILWSGYIYSVTCIANVFMPDIWSALVFDFFNNVTGTFQEYVIFMAISENCQENLRPYATNITGSGYSIASIVFILSFYWLNSWKIPLEISAGLNLVFTALIHFFMYENPKYYLKRGKVDMFVKTLKKIAKFNGCSKDFDPYANVILSEFEDEVEQTKSGLLLNSEQKSLLSKIKAYNLEKEANMKQYNILDVLRYRSHRYIFLLQAYLGILLGGVYQAYSNNIGNLPYNAFYTGAVTSAVELLCSWVTGPIMNIKCLGRKILLYISLACCLALNIIIIATNIGGIGLTILTQLSRVLINFAGNFNSPYSIELFSSKLLNSAFAWSGALSTLAAAFLPFATNYMNQIQLNYIFGAMVIVGVVCIYFLPETKNRPQLVDIPEEKLLRENQRQQI